MRRSSCPARIENNAPPQLKIVLPDIEEPHSPYCSPSDSPSSFKLGDYYCPFNPGPDSALSPGPSVDCTSHGAFSRFDWSGPAKTFMDEAREIIARAARKNAFYYVK